MKRDLLQLGISSAIVLLAWRFGHVYNFAAIFLIGFSSSFLLGKFLPRFDR